MRTWVRWLVWLCLSLMLWMAAAESAHTHPSATEAAACSICVVAHSASPALIASDSAPILSTVGLLRDNEVVVNVRLTSSDAGIRGPPAVL